MLSQAVNYFNMIILDINMPGKNGMQACSEILDYLESADDDIDKKNDNNNQTFRSRQFFSSSFLREQKRRKALSDQRLDFLGKHAHAPKFNCT